MLTEKDLVKVTSDTKVLLEIYKQLISLNSNIEALREYLKPSNTNIPFSGETSLKIDYTELKRAKLMKLVRELDNKPEEWTKLSNKELIKLLER